MTHIKKQPNSRSKINWLLAGLFMFHLLVGHVAFRGYVLCLGFDGHVAIESSADQATCMDAKTQPPAPESLPLPGLNYISGGNDCCLCVDLPMSSDCHEFAKNLEKRVPQAFPLALKTNSHGGFSAAGNESSTSKHHFNIPIKPSLISLQTTVLLI